MADRIESVPPFRLIVSKPALALDVAAGRSDVPAIEVDRVGAIAASTAEPDTITTALYFRRLTSVVRR